MKMEVVNWWSRLVSSDPNSRGGGVYLPQVLVPTVKQAPKAVAVKAETEEQ